MRVAKKFEVGKYYQFIGHQLVLKEEHKAKTWTGAQSPEMWKYDIEIPCWMDRCARRCTYADPIDGTSASFEDIIMLTAKGCIPWTTPRPYLAYLKMGMFIEVEVS